MRKKKKSEEGGFNVWRSYSDMMAGVLLLFVLIMCVTLFQAQKSYNESIKERDDKIAPWMKRPPFCPNSSRRLIILLV